MSRDRRAILVALLVVVAIGLVAATLSNPTDTSPGTGTGPGSGSSAESTVSQTPQEGQASVYESNSEESIISAGACVPFMQSDLALGIVAVALLLAGLAIRRKTTTVVAVVIVLAFIPPIAILQGLFTQCGTNPTTPMDQPSSINISNQTLQVQNGSAGGGGEVVTSPPVLLFGVLLLGILLFFLFIRGSGDDEYDEPPEEAEDEPLDDIADVAGDAADRIESQSDLENAVFRAWRDMTAHLDIASPETTTPAEFATAARDAGMQAQHVDTLTDLFREVRYGGQPVTEERERRALDALRDIEAAYGEDDE